MRRSVVVICLAGSLGLAVPASADPVVKACAAASVTVNGQEVVNQPYTCVEA